MKLNVSLVLILSMIALSVRTQSTNEFMNYTSSTNSVAILNYEAEDEILKFEKLELGIPLSNVFKTGINNFISKAEVPESQKINPFLEWEFRVFAEFQQDGKEPIIVDGFYTREYDSWSAKTLPVPSNGDSYSYKEYKNVGGWNETSTVYPFRIRFAPPSDGNWNVVVKIIAKNQEVQSFPAIAFKVSDSENTGYVSVSKEKRYLERGENSFFPVGCNLAWPETDSLGDPDLFNYLSYTDKSANYYYRSSEGYRANYVAPRVYNVYKKRMTELARHGANYIRTIMYPTATDIEWEEVGNYSDRMAIAQEMDEILEHAKNEGLFLHWNMQIHYSFQLSKRAYWLGWTWDAEIEGAPFGYRTLIDSDDPVDFLSHEEAKKYYKQRLRYILARWGYSTNIAVWELFSEISNIGSPAADNSEFYMSNENWKIYRDWQVEMANYVKSQYYGKVHLLTASFGGPKNSNDDTFHDPNFDVMTSNIYDFGSPDFSSFWANTVSKHYLHDLAGDENALFESYTTSHIDPTNTIRKPMIYSESDPLSSLCDENYLEGKRAIWESMFSGLAGSLSWDIRLHPDVFDIFKDTRLFIQQFDLHQNGWHPGSIERNVEGKWEYNDDFAIDLNPQFQERKTKKWKSGKADLAYLRSADGNFAFGVITNKTFNVYSSDSCFATIEWPDSYSTLVLPEIISLKKESVRLRGLSKGRFIIEYFLPSDPFNAIAVSSGRGEKLKFDLEIPPNENGYIILFKAHRKKFEWSDLNKIK